MSVDTTVSKYPLLLSSGFKLETTSFFGTLVLYLATSRGVRAWRINREFGGEKVLMRIFAPKGV
jgi:hypothetical protein